jgi:hypothetical protein
MGGIFTKQDVSQMEERYDKDTFYLPRQYLSLTYRGVCAEGYGGEEGA